MILGWLQETQQVLRQAILLNQNQTWNYCMTEPGNCLPMEFEVLWISQMIWSFTGYFMVLNLFSCHISTHFFSEVSKKCCDKNSLSLENKKLHLLKKKLAFLSLSSALCLHRPFIISVYEFFIYCTLFGGMNSLFYSCFLVNTMERYLIVVFSKIKVAPLH